MGKGHRTCEACGVKERHNEGSLLFSRFPLDPDRCRAWIKAVGNEELVHLPIEKLHTSRCLCSNHFEKKHFNKKRSRLKRHAIPTLNLLAPPLNDQQLEGFPRYIGKENAGNEPSTSQSRQNTEHQEVMSQNFAPVLEAKALQEISQNEQMSPSKRFAEALENVAKKPKTTLQGNISRKSMTASATETVVSTSHAESVVPVSTTEGVASTSHQESIDLSPRKKKILKQLRDTKCTLKALRKSAKVIEKLDSEVLKEIVACAIKNQHRSLHGRRWTPRNKVSCLAIYKRSPKVYRYMQQLMPLPSEKTLQNLLKKVPMEPGINEAVITHLKKIAENTDKRDKYCALVFDEIALKKRLIYNPATDKVEGFQDLGSGESGRSPEMANRALVFLLQGIRKKFKQPIAFYFVKDTISSSKLASLIKEIIEAVEETGFTVLNTVCDQGPTNVGALNMLRGNSDQEQNYFPYRHRNIFIVFDVPHLFKSMRNNFLNHGELIMNGRKAKWAHLLKVEEKNRNLLYLSKITATHVQPKYKAKMRVKYAAQILSNTVSAVLKLLAEAEHDPIQKKEIMDTALIIEDLDRLFDKTNGPSCPKDTKKGRRENVSEKTDHIASWVEYRKKLETVKFVNSRGVTAKNVKCVQGYLTTLRSLRDIWSTVKNLGFKYLNLRQLNQDALENLFGVIRQHSPTDRNPTCSSFIAGLKSALVAGLTTHNRNYNCEKDFKKLLTDFHDLIFESTGKTEQKSNTEEKTWEAKEVQAEVESPEFPVISLPEDFEEIVSDLGEVEKQPVIYVSGYIASKILKSRECSECQNSLKVEEPQEDPIYSYTRLREWWADKKSLTYPCKNFCRFVDSAINVFEKNVLPKMHFLNICKFTITLFMAQCDLRFLICEKHRSVITQEICMNLAMILLRRQCQRENQKVAAQEEPLADSIKKAQQQGIAK